ncbi:YggS family pyridoxal phosphate-dependent enzyme [bacterium]|nr:YggS family pyridoxal phosphate-dependent enzyme [bacterium]
MTNYIAVRKLVDDAALKAGGSPESITLVGVSKRQPIDRLIAAVHEGLREIGENRIQEVQGKKPIVEKALIESGFDISLLRWHMVGQLQSNKAAKAAALFDVIQSVDTLKVAKKISHTAEDLGKIIEVFVEVNTSGEAAKGGVQPDGLIDLVGEMRDLPGIKLNGLMTLGPLTDDKVLIRKAFDLLAELRQRVDDSFDMSALNWHLSMGMSDDFQVAIAAGSTMVRIGTAIFGARTL